MDCTTAREWIQDQLDGRLDAADANDDVVDFEAHLATCSSCATARDELRAVSASLASLERVPAPEKLRDAVMEQVVARGRPQPLGLDFPGGWPALTAAAALLLIAVMLFLPDRDAVDPVSGGEEIAEGLRQGDDDRGESYENTPPDDDGKRRDGFEKGLARGGARRLGGDESLGSGPSDGGSMEPDDAAKPRAVAKPDGSARPASAPRPLEVRYRVEDPARTARLLASVLAARKRSLDEASESDDSGAGESGKDLGADNADAKGLTAEGAGGGGAGSGRARSGRGKRGGSAGRGGGGEKSGDDRDQHDDPPADAPADEVRETEARDADAPAPDPDALPVGAVVVELTEEEFAFLRARLRALNRPADERDPEPDSVRETKLEGGDAGGTGDAEENENVDSDDEAPRTEKVELAKEDRGRLKPGTGGAPAGPATPTKKVRKVRVVLVPARTAR